MSGAELALAIVPLVIVLIEHHQTVFRRGKGLTFSKISNNQQLDFYQELHDEILLLKLTLEKVHTTSTKVLSSEALPDKSQAEAIEIALGENADNFNQILDRVLRSINDLVREKSSVLTDDDTDSQHAMLHRLRDFAETIEKKEAKKSAREKFRFARNEQTRKVAMKRIREGVRNLELVLRSSTEIFEQQRQASRKRTPVDRMRRLSEELFRKLASKWSCSCRTRHLAKLCLWSCCCTYDKRSDSSDSLDIIVSVPIEDQQSSQWEKSSIRVTQSQEDQGRARKRNHSEPQVRFAGGQAPSTSSSTSTPSSIPPGRNIESESLCELLQRARASHTSLQILFENDILWQQRAKRPGSQIRHQLDASLMSLLGDAKCWNKHSKPRDRSILAVVLAHAVMHCSEGPWLRADFDKNQIFFFREEGAQHPDVGRPLLALDFTHPQTTVDEDDNLFSVHSNPTILSLGILLLEINDGIKIEDHWAPEDLMDGSIPNESTNLTTALRLLGELDGKLWIGSQDAVRACLEWDAKNDGREDEDFVKRMYELIVEPLEKVLLQAWGVTPEQLGFDRIHKRQEAGSGGA